MVLNSFMHPTLHIVYEMKSFWGHLLSGEGGGGRE